MSDPSFNQNKPPARPAGVHLVAGAETMEDLGPVARHVIVGLLDEPMPLTLICPEEFVADRLPAPPLELVRYRRPPLPLLRGRMVDGLLRRLDGGGVRLLHALDGAALPLTRQLAARLDVDYVVSVYALGSSIRLSERRCRALLAASEPIQADLVAAGAPEEMVPVHRPGVLQARRATCFIDPAHCPAIVAAGDMDRYEPFAAVLAAFAQLRDARRECAYFVVGGGRAEKRLRQLAARLHLLGELTFVERQDPEQLTGILKAADVFVSPAPTQRLEIELLTAMAGGVPVLVAGAPAADFVVNEKTALSFKPGDSVELTVKLTTLLADRVAARSLAENALAHLRENHSPARMIRHLAELYQGILDRAKRTE